FEQDYCLTRRLALAAIDTVCPRRRGPAKCNRSRQQRRGCDGLVAVKINVGKITRRWAKYHAEILLSAVEIAWCVGLADPQFLPLVDCRPLAPIGNGNRGPASANASNRGVERCVRVRCHLILLSLRLNPATISTAFPRGEQLRGTRANAAT